MFTPASGTQTLLTASVGLLCLCLRTPLLSLGPRMPQAPTSTTITSGRTGNVSFLTIPQYSIITNAFHRAYSLNICVTRLPFSLPFSTHSLISEIQTLKSKPQCSRAISDHSSVLFCLGQDAFATALIPRKPGFSKKSLFKMPRHRLRPILPARNACPLGEGVSAL